MKTCSTLPKTPQHATHPIPPRVARPALYPKYKYPSLSSGPDVLHLDGLQHRAAQAVHHGSRGLARLERARPVTSTARRTPLLNTARRSLLLTTARQALLNTALYGLCSTRRLLRVRATHPQVELESPHPWNRNELCHRHGGRDEMTAICWRGYDEIKTGLQAARVSVIAWFV
eukprot:1441139-Pleurochrysis_carterae.AAC.1